MTKKKVFLIVQSVLCVLIAVILSVAAVRIYMEGSAWQAAGHPADWYVLGIIMIFGLTLGRTICGWLCPLGLIQELLYRIPTPKIRKNRVTRALTYLKYVIIVIFVAAIPLYYGFKYDMHVPGFCKFICPAGTFEGAVGLLSNPKNASLFAMLKILFTRKFVIMMIIALACIFCYRSFCRFICPLGAIFSLSGASTSLLPQTVILDRNGTIIYNQTGSMTEELLNELYNSVK